VIPTSLVVLVDRYGSGSQFSGNTPQVRHEFLVSYVAVMRFKLEAGFHLKWLTKSRLSVVLVHGG
jgi:hypothetical protein